MIEVATDKADITPPPGYPMAGYGVDTPRLADGTNEPLMARCTILWDDGVPHAIVTVDVLGFRHDTHLLIRSRVVALGVASPAFVLTATHTHNGPVLTEGLDPFIAYDLGDSADVESYSFDLIDIVCDLVASTLSSPRTVCTLDYFVLDENFSFNREGLAWNEREVPTLVARDSTGTPRAVLFSYAAHPVAASIQRAFDPDYPAQAIKEIEAGWDGVFAQFMTGPAGDQNPVTTLGFVESDAWGADLGVTVRNAIGVPGRSLFGPITSAYTEVALPLDIAPSPANFALVRADFAARAANPAMPGFERRHAGRMVALIDGTPLADLERDIVVPVQRWRFAGSPEFNILFSGGEVVSVLAQELRSSHGGPANLWFLAYANEIPAYIPSDGLLDHPCYAGGIDPDFPGIAGASMTVYDHLAHFKHSDAGQTNGAHQVYMAHLQSLV